MIRGILIKLFLRRSGVALTARSFITALLISTSLFISGCQSSASGSSILSSLASIFSGGDSSKTSKKLFSPAPPPTPIPAPPGCGVVPISVSFSSLPASPTSATSATYTWTGSAGSCGGGGVPNHYDVGLYSDNTCATPVGGQTFVGLSAVTTTKTFVGLVQGSYYAKVTVYDIGGLNNSACSSVFISDTTNPTVAFSSTPVTPSNSTSATWAWVGAADTGGSGLASFDIALHSNNTCTAAVAGQTFTGLTSGTSSKTFTGLVQGTYYAKVIAYDGAGNSTSACSTIYTLDTTGPSISFSSSPVTPNNSTSATWAWVGASDTGGGGLASFDIALHSNVTCTSAVGGQSFTGLSNVTTTKNFTGLTQGSYYAKLTAYDNAGNSTSICSGIYLLDTTVPTVAFSSLPTTPNNSTSATWAWVGAADTGGSGLASFDIALHSNGTCTAAVGGQSYTGLSAATTSQAFTGITQGSYYAKITAYDAAGNSATSCSTVYLLDTTAPTVSFSTVPATPGSTTSVTFAWVGAADTGGSNLNHFDTGLYSDSSCTTAVPGQTFTGLSNATTSKNYTGLSDGAFFSKITAYDGAGNSKTVCSSGFLVDTTAPTAAFSSVPVPPTTSTYGTWQWYSTVDNLGGSGINHVDIELHSNSSCTSAVGGQSFPNIASSTRFKTFTGLTDGATYYAKLTAYDEVGNISAPVCSSGYTVALTSPIKVFTGSLARHACVQLSSNQIKCWGTNGSGQLGLGENADFGDGLGEMGDGLPAVNLGTGRTATSLMNGDMSGFMCAVLDNGKLKCWGSDEFGQLGYETTNYLGDRPGQMGDSLSYVNLGLGRTAVQVTGGTSHTCVLLDNGSVKCWGRNSEGECGVGNPNPIGNTAGTMGDSLPAVNLGTGRTALQISAALYSTCAILDNHQVKCWGYNGYGELGYEDTVQRGDNAGEMGDSLPYVNLGTGKTAQNISLGVGYACAVLNDGTVKCWGYNGLGNLGYEDTVQRGDNVGQMGDSLPPLDFGGGLTALSVTSGQNETCAILIDGSVKCWGWNAYSQLGNQNASTIGATAGTMGGALVATNLGTGRTALSLVNTTYGFCALLDNSKVKCWGYNAPGPRGQEDNVAFYGGAPGQMGDALPTINLGTGRTSTQIAAGAFYACSILDNGSVKCWGRNNSGQLGLEVGSQRGDTPNEMGSFLPIVNLGTGRTAKSMGLGRNHTCAILDNDKVKCWGDNAYGQLGLENINTIGDNAGEMGDSLAYVNLGTGLTAKKITGGDNFTCAILNNNKVKCWGTNIYGMLGIGDTVQRGSSAGQMGDSLPYADLGTGMTATDVVAGQWHACALLADGSVKCWGYGPFGALGYGSGTVIAGSSGGQMGDSLPTVDLGTGRTAIGISAGYWFTCALLDNFTVKCWGYGGHGSIGQGTASNVGDVNGQMGDSLPAINLGTGRTATSISSGGFVTCAILDNSDSKCWGYGGTGQLGQAAVTSIGNAGGQMGDSLPAINFGTGLSASSFAVGVESSCIVLNNNKVKCIGYADSGFLGQGTLLNWGSYVNTMGDFLPYVDF